MLWVRLFACKLSGFRISSQNEPVANIKPKERTTQLQQNKLSLLSDLDKDSLIESEFDPQVEAAIQNYETAYQMQSSVPELMDLSGESEAVKKSYGMDSDFKNTSTFGLQCLLARRLGGEGSTVYRTHMSGGKW